MDDDDCPQGRVLSRREALARIGAAAFAALALDPARPASAMCVATPAQTEGPFFFEPRQERSDIRSDPSGGAAPRPGVPLALDLSVARLDVGGCAPIAGAVVDIWHCDADGVYSGVRSPQRFLRGYQVSGADGRVRFVTIYPGWYAGRAVHIHVKVRSGARVFASQLYFDDAFTERVFARAPYAARGRPDTRNAADFLWRDGGRALTIAPVERDGALAASFDVVLAAS